MPWEPRPRPAIRAGGVNGAMEIWISYRGIKGLAQRRHVGEGGSDRQAYRSIDGRAGAATLQGDACVLQHDRSAPRRPLHSTCLLEFQTAAPPFIAKQSISGHKGRMDCFRLRSLSYGGQVVATLFAMTWTVRLHTSMSSPANAGDPVRRALSIPSSASLEYWITRLRG